MTSPIDRLRRPVAALEAGDALDPADAAWLAGGAKAYLARAPGIRLDAALGLHPERGEAGWWTVEPRSARDAILGEIDRQLFAQLDVPQAAREIIALERRRRQRQAVDLNVGELFARLTRTGLAVPAEKQVKNILHRTRGKSYAASNFPA
jgi:hypothetical protein